MVDVNFTQINKTYELNGEKITAAFAKAAELGIRFDDLERERNVWDAALMKLFGGCMKMGGQCDVLNDDRERLEFLIDTLAEIWRSLDQMFALHEEYSKRRKEHDAWKAKVPERAARVRIADGVESTVGLRALVSHVENVEGSLRSSERAFGEVVKAIKERQMKRANFLLRSAKRFVSLEIQLRQMIGRGQLVALVTNAEGVPLA
jgi:hypothetical protein